MVVKFMFQSVFGNSRRNPRHFGARGRGESLELYSILWSDNKRFYVTEIVLPLWLQTLFFGGREATTGNASAVRRLQTTGLMYIPKMSFITMHGFLLTHWKFWIWKYVNWFVLTYGYFWLRYGKTGTKKVQLVLQQNPLWFCLCEVSSCHSTF